MLLSYEVILRICKEVEVDGTVGEQPARLAIGGGRVAGTFGGRPLALQGAVDGNVAGAWALQGVASEEPVAT